MPRASKYGTIGSAGVEEEASSAVRPILSTDSDDRLHDLYDTRPEARRWRRKNHRAARAALALGAAAAVLGLASYTAQQQQQQPASNNPGTSLMDVGPSASATTPAAAATGVEEEDLVPLSFEATNFYHLRDGKPAQDYPWLKNVQLIEPHRETTLSIPAPRDGHDYIWEVRGTSEEEEDDNTVRASARGAETSVILTDLDENMITLKEVDESGEVVRQLEETVMVKYVRREIRTLTDDEREELFDAVSEKLARPRPLPTFKCLPKTNIFVFVCMYQQESCSCFFFLGVFPLFFRSLGNKGTGVPKRVRSACMPDRPWVAIAVAVWVCL